MTHVRTRTRRAGALLSTFVLAVGAASAVLLGSGAPAAALDNGLAPLPPMGWNDWNAFGCSVDEQLVEQTADAFVSSGLRDAGYRYLNIDDCWALPDRDANGNLVANPAKFPSGIAALADYVHARGLKLGIYEDAGTHTCSKGGGFSGSLGHEDQDAMQFAQWHIDYLKYDDCNIPPDGQNVDSSIARYDTMRDALAKATAATGQPIVFSICEKGDFGVPNSAWPTVGNLWRTTGDIHDNYKRMVALFKQNVVLADLAGPNHWNDPDMLEIGNGGMNTVEYQTHFALWAEMAAPLIAGTDVTKMSAATRDILTNRDVIAVDQDSLGAQGRVVSSADGHWVLSKPLADGSRAVTLFNETDAPATISTSAAQVGLAKFPDYRLRDLWSHTDSESGGTITDTVPAHATAMYRVTPARGLDLTDPPHVALGLAGVTDTMATGALTAVHATMTDDGRLPALSGTLSVDWPAGWTASPAHPVPVPALAPGRSKTVAFRVSAAAPTIPLPEAPVTATLRYRGIGRATAVKTFTQAVHLVTPVQPPNKTFAAVDSTTSPRFGQLGPRLAIIAAGADVSGTNNQYGTIYRPASAGPASVIITEVTAQQVLNSGMKSGLIVRNDLTKASDSPGYVTLETTPSHTVQMQWDADGDGQLESSTTVNAPATPIWLRLVRAGTTFTGSYSTDGTTWTTVTSATVASATGTEDAGVFTSSHNKYLDARADFGSFDIE